MLAALGPVADGEEEERGERNRLLNRSTALPAVTDGSVLLLPPVRAADKLGLAILDDEDWGEGAGLVPTDPKLCSTPPAAPPPTLPPM